MNSLYVCVYVFAEEVVRNMYHSVKAVTFGEGMGVNWSEIEQDRITFWIIVFCIVCSFDKSRYCFLNYIRIF